MTEYIIIVALIAIAAIGVFTFFGGTVRSQMGAITNELAGKDGKQQMTQAGTQAGKAQEESQKGKTLEDYSNTSKKK